MVLRLFVGLAANPSPIVAQMPGGPTAQMWRQPGDFRHDVLLIGDSCANHDCVATSFGLPEQRRRVRQTMLPGGQGQIEMTALLGSYLPIAIFIGISLVIGLALLIAPFAVAFKAPDPEKLSAFECGFNAFDDARMKFDIRFYLVSILFIIFDLEVAFLFPWAVSFGDMGWFGFWSMMVFLGVLTIGFIYEWKKGALEWE
jgi:NADH-quinone oxidoreductase subunit A